MTLLQSACSPDLYHRPAIVEDAIARRSGLRGGVIALGNFDGFHRGHQFLIRMARRIAGDGSALGVMSVEPHPRQVFNPDAPAFRLATSGQKHDMARMLNLDFLYQPVFDRDFAAQSAEDFIEHVLHRALGVSHVVVGADFRFGAGRAGDVAMLHRMGAPRGIGVTVMPLQGGHSSTAIRKAVTAGDMETARAGLGRPWQAQILHDGGIQRLDPAQIRPAAGSYLIRNHGDKRAQYIALDHHGRIRSAQPLPQRIGFLERCGPDIQ